MRGTFCVKARCAELYPEAVAQIVRSGHDVAGHGYLQDQLLAYMAPGRGAGHHPPLPRCAREGRRASARRAGSAR